MNNNQTLILAIETSCDETSVSIIKNGTEILSNTVLSQIESHKRFGGVVPEIASRHHVEGITTTIDESLQTANVSMRYRCYSCNSRTRSYWSITYWH